MLSKNFKQGLRYLCQGLCALEGFRDQSLEGLKHLPSGVDFHLEKRGHVRYVAFKASTRFSLLRPNLTVVMAAQESLPHGNLMPGIIIMRISTMS